MQSEGGEAGPENLTKYVQLVYNLHRKVPLVPEIQLAMVVG